MIPKPIPPLLHGLRRKHYVTTAVDVPWDYVTYSKKNQDRAPDYDVMNLDDIAALPVMDYVADNSRMLFWITGPFLAAGLHVPILDAWGFEPTAMWGVWIKPVEAYYRNPHGVTLDDHLFKMGLGHTTRQNAEYVIEARRGDPPERRSKSIRQIIVEPAREHSRKPEKFYERAEAYSTGPFLELFGRQRRAGWTVRGNERDKFKP